MFNDTQICTICHETVEEYYKSCCNQYYHVECLYSWLKTSPKCPICKTRTSSYIINVMKNWSKTLNIKDKNKIYYDLKYCKKYDFCSICYYRVDDNISCEGYKYHLTCIKNCKECPECNEPISNDTIYNIISSIKAGNIFHKNFLNHTREEYDNRIILNVKRTDIKRNINLFNTPTQSMDPVHRALIRHRNQHRQELEITFIPHAPPAPPIVPSVMRLLNNNNIDNSFQY
jgi:hypothetical protein